MIASSNKIITNKVVSKVILPDIACTSCSSVIESYFNKLADIEVTINFISKKAQFTYNSKVWNEAKIQKIMHQLGYKVYDFETQDIKHQNYTLKIHQNHLHETKDHEQHMADNHEHSHLNHLNFKIRDLVEVIMGWILLIPLLIIMIPHTSVLDPLRNPYVQLGLTIPIQFYFGRKFYFGIYREIIKQRRPAMDTLIALGTNTAFIFSIYLMAVNKTDHLFFEVAASIIMIVLLGDLITAFVKTKATNSLTALMTLTPKTVLKYDLKVKQETLVDIEYVQVNDILIVRKGEAIPTDGILISSRAIINESVLTGESKLIQKIKNQPLIGGSLNMGESFQMKTTKIGQETVLANIIRAAESAQAQKPKLQTIADKISSWFTPTVILIALLVFIIRFWAFNNSLEQAIEVAIAVLIISCPCALGIATPLAVAVGINKAAKIGIIYNKTEAFEKITKIDTICFDKTGTLTTGKIIITKIYGNQSNIKSAIAMEKHSTHPLAQAFSWYENYNQITDLPQMSDIKEVIGFGLTAKFNKQELQLSAFSKLKKLPLSADLTQFDAANKEDNQTLLALAINNVITNIFVLEDQLQENAVATILKIQKQGIKVVLISGDHEDQTATIARKVGIDNYFANVKPIEKADIVASLQAQGQKVAFVGDGVNDIVALQKADLAIAMGTGSDIAKQIGDITISVPDIMAVYKAIVLTKKTKNNIWMNFIWAFGYNIVIIPLAAFGFIIPPLAAIAMALSDITVVGNSLIFKWKKYKY